jgi:DNA gyrase/topoisomerase IV subunit A
MTDKTFTVAGTSKHAGAYKVRFANDLMRTKNLTKSGHTDIILVELPQAMSKLDAIKHIATLDEFDNVGSKSAIMDYLDRKDVEPKSKGPAVKAPAAVKATATKAKAKVAVAADEDAPF